jgi:catechol 2,3-dioxygenase
MTTTAQTTPTTAIAPATEGGLVSLTVSDLARSVAFYTEAIGLGLLRQDDGTAVLGVSGQPLLLLTERSGARPWPREQSSYTGLYHFAILVPTRADLGRWVRHWLELSLPLGQGDHLVSEALYLSDPDENGIEVYRDRPRDEWTWQDGRVRMGTGPVDISGLLAEAEREGKAWDGLPAGTRIGHIHLQIGDIAKGATFYHDILGFDIVARMPSALFVSAGGYHHHIGMNTWHSLGATPAPADVVGLRFFTIDLPDADGLTAVVARLTAAGIPHTRAGDVVGVRDPWGIALLLHIGAVADAPETSALVTLAEALPVTASLA